MRGGTKDERTELTETLRDLISRGRAAGMIVIAATQKPSNDIIPTFVRDLFSFRMALRCTTPEASDTILGQGWAKQGYSASTLDPTARGVGYLLAEGAVPVKLRTHYLDDDAIAELATAGRARGGTHGELGLPLALASWPRSTRPGCARTRSACGADRSTGRPASWSRATSSSPARTGGPPSARRAPASTKPTPGSSWRPASVAARAWTPASPSTPSSSSP